LTPFVSAQIASQYGKAYFLAHAKQTTGIATINQKVLAGFPLMIPPLAEQQRVAAMLSRRMEGVERLRQSLEGQLDAINKLPAALLRNAFRGELG
jgi:type I restriction enzyme, S subunit